MFNYKRMMFAMSRAIDATWVLNLVFLMLVWWWYKEPHNDWLMLSVKILVAFYIARNLVLETLYYWRHYELNTLTTKVIYLDAVTTVEIGHRDAFVRQAKERGLYRDEPFSGYLFNPNGEHSELPDGVTPLSSYPKRVALIFAGDIVAAAAHNNHKDDPDIVAEKIREAMKQERDYRGRRRYSDAMVYNGEPGFVFINGTYFYDFAAEGTPADIGAEASAEN